MKLINKIKRQVEINKIKSKPTNGRFRFKYKIASKTGGALIRKMVVKYGVENVLEHIHDRIYGSTLHVLSDDLKNGVETLASKCRSKTKDYKVNSVSVAAWYYVYGYALMTMANDYVDCARYDMSVNSLRTLMGIPTYNGNVVVCKVKDVMACVNPHALDITDLHGNPVYVPWALVNMHFSRTINLDYVATYMARYNRQLEASK